MIELVVAHYTENLNWLRNLPAGLTKTVYSKSPDPVSEHTVIPLPNVGREAHTYLHHIINRYDSLAEWTVFCQGKPFDHAYDFKKTLRELVTEPLSFQGKEFHWFGHLIDTDDNLGHRLFQPWSKNDDGRGLDLVGFHRTLFDSDGPTLYTFVLGAQFAVHRNLLHQKPVSFYKRALEISVLFPDAAHCFERSWDRVFDVVGLDPGWLAGRLTVQLKPMRHQQTD
ncbi:DUF3431 domain-containing protein [Spirosoma sp. KCTC 42546]|uniref:DUF3431 domain-containing protein n=1 Tax=Spirosoma sp. KCTC 42546 TaxID=2520506 RepID=UPI001157F99A|nr:DUF3431 domain-containing protein [Spirosoma sp. KCTC 42546]QDK77666.1 DUF3431 domain-containing protein [Spirosoma sp. KCTC 42546]